MVAWLEENWTRPNWRGLRRVRVIHGKGEVLPFALREWCDSRGIPWAPEAGNPGCTILHPASRVAPATASAPRRTRPIRSVPPERPPDPADAELFEKAVSDIEDLGRGILRRKHS